jgi:hypothetical protein
MSTPVSDRTLSRTVKSRNSKNRQAPHEESSIPTAALQNKLLPRRRQRKTTRTGASGFEVVSDSDEDLTQADEDEDELSFLPLRRRPQTRRKSASKAKPRSGGKKLGATKQYGASVREEANIDKENEPAEMSSPLSSALDSDAFDSDFLLEQEAPVKNYLSEELRLQALKFAEVDKWQMEFEDVITVQDNGEFR